MFRLIALFLITIMVAGFLSTSASAEVCATWGSTPGYLPCEDGYIPPCICQVIPDPYCHEVWTLEWKCLADFMHQDDCGEWDCTSVSLDNETVVHCDTSWCGRDQWHTIYGPKVYCSICMH